MSANPDDDSWPGQLLHQAAIYNSVDLLQCLLQGEERLNINAQDICGRTAVYTAVSNDSLQCLELLLDHGADANIPAGARCHNMTPLHEAVLDSKLEALSILLARGANVTAIDVSGKTPLALAKDMKNRRAIDIIKNEKEKKKVLLDQLSTELCEACAEGQLEKVKNVLDRSGVYRKHVINMTTKGLSPLGIVSKCGYVDILSYLLEEGASCVSHKDTGLTLLHLACESGNIGIIQILLKMYPDLLCVRSVEHQLPIHSAVICNKVEAVRLLLEFPYPSSHLLTFTDPATSLSYQMGLEVNAEDASGETPLHIACRNGYAEIVNLLMTYTLKIKVEKELHNPEALGFTINDSDSEDEESDLELPEQNSGQSDHTGTEEREKFETIYPVDINLLNHDGFSPFHLAIKHNRLDVVNILLRTRKSLLSKLKMNDAEVSVLMFAYEHSSMEIMKALLQHGLKDDEDKVLNAAFFSQDLAVKWLLLSHKSGKDSTLGRAINKTEMRKIALRPSEQEDKCLSLDPDYKSRFPITPVAILWEGLGMLDKMESSCLVAACFLHNPAMSPALPEDICLCAITKVDISKNSFEKFPILLLGLPSLTFLKASRNQIAEIPEDCTISCLFLEELHLNENKIKSLPKFIFQLPQLKYLDVSVNKIKELPLEMWEAPALISLNLSRNCLSQLPCLTNDQMFSKFTGSKLNKSGHFAPNRSYSGSVTSFDENCQLVDETEYVIVPVNGVNHKPDVTNNQILRVNKWQSGITVVDSDPWKGSNHQLSGLKQLWLNMNKFTQVPSCLVCCAPNLEVLVLSDNPLTSIGSITDYPPFLVELDLSKTGISNMDPWKHPFDQSHDFTCLAPMSSFSTNKYSPTSRLSSPRSGSFPRFNSISSYHSMSPSSGQRDSLFLPCLHRCHSTLKKLEKLNLSHNRLSKVTLTKDPLADFDSQSVCSMESEEVQLRLLFPHLLELNLSRNLLTSLPSDIGELGSLKILSLTGNIKLKELPPKLGLLKNLWKLELDLCPIDGAIQDFLLNSRYPVKDILGFLQSVLEESTEYNCMNLMLVGFHKIGKTSLLHRLSEKGKLRYKPSHWRDRLKMAEGTKQSFPFLSTVGIDINELIIERRSKGQVIFRTWDFGGQKEYYATHQYFLSPRSLYLVVWSITEGERGVESILQWLVNIQARAPGAPCIIVGTHLDVLHDRATRRNYPEDFEQSMMQMIDKMFLSNQEPEKSGLPNILKAINVSCKTGENIKQLVDDIYECVFELKHPRSKTRYLIKQKIPRKYLLLQMIVRQLAIERIIDFKEPVLSRSKYMLLVQNKMMENGMTFRDIEELEQATRFLHENGVLFHYDDLALRDLFFLDPQWLCDQLARVITVKEINNFAQRGVMRLSNLEFLFKSNSFQPEHIKVYITSLLNKFEVALQFDEEFLLLPSLLPTEMEVQEMARRKSDVRIPLRKPSDGCVGLPKESPTVERRVESLIRSLNTGQALTEGPPGILHVGSSTFYTGSQVRHEVATIASLRESGKYLLLAIKPTSNPIFSCCRLYFMTYFPSGFWPRLITRMLGDPSIYSIVKELFLVPSDLIKKTPEVKCLTDRDPEWRCWQTGLELFYMGFEMLRIREVFFSAHSFFCDYSKCRIKCSIDNEWSLLDVDNSKILEIIFPTDSLRFHVTNKDGPQLQNLDNSKPSSTIYREEVATTKLLVKIVEHVDNLLQDWYPDIGELRFSQNVEGRYLVTRIVPCPQCLNVEVTRQKSFHQDQNSWYILNPDLPDLCFPVVIPESNSQNHFVRDRSNTTIGCSRTVIEEPVLEPVVTRPRTLTEGQAFIYNKGSLDGEPVIFSWLIERCMLDALEGVDAVCPRHGSISPIYLMGREGVTHQLFLAPDTVFQDQSQTILLPAFTQLDIGKDCLGKGNFGEVHPGLLFSKDNRNPEQVAVKILFKQVQTRKDIKKGFHTFLEKACHAYLTARQEVSILSQLEHPNIVPLIALHLKPLSLVLALAPHGSLDAKLSQMNKLGEYFPLFVIKDIILQVSKALSYLHSHNIIYRDLKAENVLVWELPPSDSPPRKGVNLKLADYGISRSVLPTGTKGFGGTPPFIAPEILQHAGKGTYTTKVDVFSFGMFMFELLTCRIPFNQLNNLNNLICQGERPSLTVQEAERWPTYILDLMALCWSQDPDQRPTMEGVVGIAKSPQFCHLQDVVSLGPDVAIYSACCITQKNSHLVHDIKPNVPSPTMSEQMMNTEVSSSCQLSQIWLSSGLQGKNAIEMFTFNQAQKVDSYRTLSLPGQRIIAMCALGDVAWCIDSQGLIQIIHTECLSDIQEIQLPMDSFTNKILNIVSVHPLPSHGFVLIVSADGTLFQCNIPGQAVRLEERAVEIYKVETCYSSALVHTTDRCELWLGQSNGGVSVWNIQTKALEYCLSHGSKIVRATSSSSVAFLVTSSSFEMDCTNVWSYNYPGSIICLWNTKSRMIVKKLDCYQIVSTVDSPVLATSEHFECGQVCALSAIDCYLYVGTTRGTILVTEAVTLIPLCLFACHAKQDFYIKFILPLLSPCSESNGEPENVDKKENDVLQRRVPAVVTVGSGYTNLLKVFHPTLDAIPAMKSDYLLHSLPTTASQINPYANHKFMLVWNAVDWEHY
uniref:non-specific serine/threonine protein kinase n=1 Tax=Biomphalaria glabrata TaxID=6526 RepID=A0A2C9JFX8_BIOGL